MFLRETLHIATPPLLVPLLSASTRLSPNDYQQLLSNRASGLKAQLYDHLLSRKQMPVALRGQFSEITNRSTWLIIMQNDSIGTSYYGSPTKGPELRGWQQCSAAQAGSTLDRRWERDKA